ncbi:serine hydrolase [Steroidobacter sp.]|uniref:serine hydrolase n=1 Tax=Steroidobacter sp. TaxID=1978227 RepID=UPI001A48F1A2|nr:serine hydrolase [Steroidobacter sp.]MBL8268823.1 serine hydrolase [Steroidobacter sp.]
MAATVAVADDQQSFAALDRYIEQARQDWQIPGAAIGVIRNGEVIYVKGFGEREAGKAARVDEHSLFQIGSLTKAFTAAAVGLLVDEGKLAWDDPVVKHLPTFMVADPWLTRNITVRDLIAHRTGLEGGTHVMKPGDPARRMKEVSTMTSNIPFRSSVLYSNSMYDVAGQVIAAVSGMSWDDFIAQRLLAPLQLRESSPDVVAARIWDSKYLAPSMYGQAPAIRASIDNAPQANVTMPHWLTKDGNKPLPWQILLPGGGGASGSMVSNLHDLLTWTRFNMGDGRTANGTPLLREQTLRELHTAQIFVDRPSSASSEITWRTVRQAVPGNDAVSYRPAYALGWFVNTYRGYRYINHGGALLGAMSTIAFLPERQLAVVVLTNSYGTGGRGLFNPAVTLRVVDEFLGVEPRNWSADLRRTFDAYDPMAKQDRERQLQSARPKKQPPSLPLASYGGEYESEAFGKVEVVRSGDRLALRLPGVFEWPLEHWHRDTFRMHVTSGGVELMDFLATFQVDPLGRITSFDPGWVLFGGAMKPVKKN